MDIQRAGASGLDIKVGIPARDQMHFQASLNAASKIASFRLTGVGCPDLLRALVVLREELRKRVQESGENGLDVNSLSLPTGNDHASILMRELVLRVQGRWSPPYTDEELCHCRAVLTERVDRAIICGSHTVQQIARETSAGTSCGTCRPDSEALIKYRLCQE